MQLELAKIVNFDSFRAYRWLTTVAQPDAKLYNYLRSYGVDLKHVINLLDGAIALGGWSLGGQKEDCIFLPVMQEDGTTPLDLVVFSMANPTRFGTMLGLGAILGAGEVLNPATYWADQPCRLLRTPLQWLAEGIEGCAVILDPAHAKSILDWAPGSLAAMDDGHAVELVDMGAVDPKRLVVPLPRRAA